MGGETRREVAALSRIWIVRLSGVLMIVGFLLLFFDDVDDRAHGVDAGCGNGDVSNSRARLKSKARGARNFNLGFRISLRILPPCCARSSTG